MGEEPTTTNATEATNATQENKKAAMQIIKKGLQRGLHVFQGGFKRIVFGALSFPKALLGVSVSARLVTVGFFVSIGVLVFTSKQLYQKFFAHQLHKSQHQSQSEAGSSMSSFIVAQRELAIAKANVLFLGVFSVNLKPNQGRVNLLEFELYVECDRPETSAILREKLEHMRETIAQVIQEESYDVLLTEQGKVSFKNRIGETINQTIKRWKFNGSVKNLFLSRFIMG